MSYILGRSPSSNLTKSTKIKLDRQTKLKPHDQCQPAPP
ncbi:hypothetical protein APA_2910 [Pseudanabaena sp. lw0831]|nr:hypothetical protein APA_2910 [Pseudanabaena sp. lw0831]